MSNISDITVALLEAQAPGAANNIRAAVLFETVFEFCQDVLQVQPPGDFLSNPGIWLTDDQWVQHHTTLLSGALARLYAMPNKPWTNAQAAQAHAALYQLGYARGRAYEALPAITTTGVQRIRATVRAYMPAVRDRVFTQALFPVVDTIARDVLQSAVPVNSDPPEAWIGPEQYNAHLTLITDGVLAYLYGMQGQPWGELEKAKLHAGMWLAGIPRARERYAATLAAYTGYDRIMVNLRVIIADARDPVLALAVQDTINDFKQNVLQLAPEAGIAIEPYGTTYRAILAGSLVRLYVQPNKPWTNTDAAKIQRAVYEAEAGISRSDAASPNTSDALARILMIARLRMPTVLDNMIYQALFVVVDKVARDVLQSTPPVNTAPAYEWIGLAQYAANMNLILNGVYAQLYAMPGQAWTSPDLAKTYTTLWDQELPRARERYAATQSVATGYERVLVTVRVLVPDARDPVINLALQDALNDFSYNVLQLAPGANVPLDPGSVNYRAVLANTLGRLYAQPNKPWTSADAAKLQQSVYNQECAVARGDITTNDASSAFARIMMAVRVQLPTVRDTIVYQSLFAVVDRLCRDITQTTPPLQNALPSAWLPAGQYADNFNLILNGLLARLYTMPSQAWTSPDLAKAYFDLWAAELPRARERYATAQAPASGYERVMLVVKAMVTDARDPMLAVALDDTVAAYKRVVLQTGPGEPLNIDTSDTSYRAIRAGTLARVYAQPGKPWTNLDVAKLHQEEYEAEVAIARSDLVTTTVANAVTRLMMLIRLQVPTVQDETIHQGLWKAADRLCRDVFQSAPPVETDPPAMWLTPAQYSENANLLFNGVLAYVYAISGQAWTALDLAKVYGDLWSAELPRVRERYASVQVAATGYDRIVRNIRALIVGIRDPMITISLEDTIMEYKRGVLQTGPGEPLNIDPTDTSYRAIMAGTLARLYAQPDKPWTNADAAKQQSAIYDAESIVARSDLATTLYASAYLRMMMAIRLRVTMVQDEVAHQSLWAVANRLCRDVTQTAPPAQNTDPTTWLSADQYADNFNLILNGVLADLYAMPAQTWTNSELAKTHFDLWAFELPRARERYAAAQPMPTGYERVIASMRALVPDVRDAVLNLVIGDAINHYKRVALQTGPGEPLNIDATDTSYRAILSGALARLYAQPGKPWTNAEAAAAYAATYDSEIAVTRGDLTTTTSTAAFMRLMMIVRLQLPTIQDEVIHQGVWVSADRLCRDVFQIAPPVQTDLPANWLPAGQYADNFNLILNGVLGHLKAMPGQAWTNIEQAKAHNDLWLTELPRARERYATAQVVSTGYGRIMLNLRAQVPAARDLLLNAALFDTINDVQHNVFQVPYSAHNAAPETWLTADQYDVNYRLLLAGTLARLYAQLDKPWTNVDGAKVHENIYAAEIAIARGDAVTETSVTALNRILMAVRMHLPTVRDTVLYQGLWSVVDRVARDVLQVTAPVQSTPAASWLSDAQYNGNLNLIVNGLLAYLQAMPGQEWTAQEQAKVHATLWDQEYPRARERYASAQPVADGYGRILQNIRTLVPGMRDDAINQELFNVVEVLQRNVRQGAVPDYSASPQAWIPPADYRAFFSLLLNGTLARIYSQSNKPWTDPQAAIARRASYEDEVLVARNDAQGVEAIAPTARLLGSLRAQLNGIKDAAIYQELFNVVHEACNKYYVWVDVRGYVLEPGVQMYVVAPAGCDVVKMGDITHSKIDARDIQFDGASNVVYIKPEVTLETATEAMFVRCVLSPAITLAPEKLAQVLPYDIWTRFHQMFLEGCLHRLMLQPMKPWSDARLGAVHGQVYRRLLTEAMAEARSSGILPQRQNWVFPRFMQ